VLSVVASGDSVVGTDVST